MANILLITYFFPPLNAAACRRVYSWAKYFQKAGHDVIILTADVPVEKQVKNFDVDVSFLKIYRLKYFDIQRIINRTLRRYRPLSERLEGRNKNKLFVGFAKKVLHFLTTNLLDRGFLFGVGRSPTFADQWFFRAYKEAKKIIKKHNINVIISSSPPHVSHVVGAFLKQKFNDIAFIVDFQDPWVQNPSYKGCFPFTLLEKYFERKCVKESDAVIIVSHIWLQKLRNRYPYKYSRFFCIENGYDEYFVKGTNAYEIRRTSAKKTIIYTGTLYNNRGSPEPLFQAVNEDYEYLSDKLEIIFYGAYETKRILSQFFEKYLATECIIRYGGFLSGREVAKEQMNTDALLFIEKDRENDGLLTSKIYEYIILKKPILSIGISPTSYVGSFLKRTGLCIICGSDLEKIKESLHSLIEETTVIHPDSDYIEQFATKKHVEEAQVIIKDCLDRNRIEKS